VKTSWKGLIYAARCCFGILWRRHLSKYWICAFHSRRHGLGLGVDHCHDRVLMILMRNRLFHFTPPIWGHNQLSPVTADFGARFLKLPSRSDLDSKQYTSMHLVFVTASTPRMVKPPASGMDRYPGDTSKKAGTYRASESRKAATWAGGRSARKLSDAMTEEGLTSRRRHHWQRHGNITSTIIAQLHRRGFAMILSFSLPRT
jgi:hypothetical protein